MKTALERPINRVYDDSGASPVLTARATAAHGGMCAGQSCWKMLSTNKLKYSDPDRMPDGIDKLTLKAGGPGKAAITLKARGGDLANPPLPLGIPTIVQLLSTNGSCWGAQFGAAGVKKNAADAFKGVGN